ncbi:protein AKNAD1 isoform X2 [Chroicocephalus ridibundus]|uniref:protein AKNAD1 isoform X2 n=1 Tax=Chroicocephalus ridibundus TaxID=1192867 RepID=UPI002FDE248A
MESTKEYKLSVWMKTQMNSSFSDELDCITNATDEEQDDLPYDGDVGITCTDSNSDHLNDCTCTKDISSILNLACSEDNKNVKATANYETHPQLEEFSSHHRGAIGTTGIAVEMPGSETSFKTQLPIGSFSKPDSKEHLTHSKMSDVLLRHFSKGELISTCQLIECETIPETSFTESINDAVNKPEPSKHVKGPLAHKQRATNFEEYHLEKHEEVNAGDKNQNSLNENRCISKKPISSTGKCGCRQENSQVINENEDTHLFQNMKEERDLLKKTVSLQELKYGQGQAHYCLPDFSEVASEVQVPERSDNINSVPTTERTRSFPFLLSKSVIVNSVLENKNYFNSAEVENQEETSIPELLQQLEMQTQYADNQNHIDPLRLNPKMLPQSDFPNASIAIYSGDTGTSSEVFTSQTLIPIQPTRDLSKARLQCGTTASAAATVKAHCLNPSNSLPELTLGEKMSQVLKDQTDQLIKKVEDFSKHMTQETFLLQDNYLALNQLKRYLDALERNYLTAREKHHNLQLQNYKDKSIDVGEFDPERKVEGEIFRLGMLLEDIQEQSDDSKCNLSSLLTSYESAHSSYSLFESPVVSSIADPPQRGTETAFLHKNDEKEKCQTTDGIPQTNQVCLEGDKCNLCLHMLQKRAESTSRRGTEPLGRGGLLAHKHSSNLMRFLSPEEKYAAEGLGSHRQGTLSQKFNPDEESMKGNTNIQETKTGTCSLFIQRKPTDLSDTNLSSHSEDISAYDSYDSQSEELENCETDSYKTFSARLCGERKGLRCRCPRGSRDKFKLRNYRESVQSCALRRNKSSGSTSYLQKRISTQKAQKNKQPLEFVNRLSERQNFEAAKTCYSSTYDKIILSRQYLPSKKSAQSKSAINIRSASDSSAVFYFSHQILSSTLDHAIQTANSLKKATERMVRAVSEDLAKVKRKQL